MCFHDTGGLHSRQLMGKSAQTTCMYFLYSYVFSSSRDDHSADEQAYTDFPRDPQIIHPVHLMCFHDAGELHSLQLMGNDAQTTAMYSLYSLNSGRRWAPSPMNNRRCAACTCVLVYLTGRWWAPSPMEYRRSAACTCVLVSFSGRRWAPSTMN